MFGLEFCALWPYIFALVTLFHKFLVCLAATTTYYCVLENSLKYFPHVNNVSHSRMMYIKLFGKGLKSLCKFMSRKSEVDANVFPPQHCVNTHMKNAPDQQTAKPVAFIEVLLPADDQVSQAHLIISKWLLLVF